MASRARQQASRVFEVLENATDGVKTKIADQAARLVGISERLNTSDQAWSALGHYVTQHVACVLAKRPSTSMDGDNLKGPWDKLQICVQQIEDACSARLQRDRLVSVAVAEADVQQLAVLRREFDDAFGLFKLNLDLKNFTEAEKFLSTMNIDQLTESMIAKVKDDLVPQAINDLPYAAGASWDPTRACLPGTRVEMIDDMWNFIIAAEGATCAQIFWLVDVAGSGKTAIAHSVCQKAHDAGLLVTSFFFERMSAERNNPDKVITTIARDLATRDKRIARSMASALDRDASLRSASITRQFNELIALPSVKALGELQQPHVIFLDGLDEGMLPDEQLTAILSTGVCVLPGNFRILVTSRPIPEITYAFENVAHIQKHTVNLRGTSNQGDISTYITHQMVKVASKRRRKLPWPEPSLVVQLVKKSEGHFLWASAVTEFLARATNPDRQLDALLSLKGAHNTEAKMDQLYGAVLKMCPWGDDVDFLDEYEIYMGTLIAAKEPLTANAMQKLHNHPHHPRDIFERLSSLITGFDQDDEVVRPLHLSLKEYLTLRAPSPYHLVEKEHSQALAELCLRTLNQELAMEIPSLDTFSLDDPGCTKIPEIRTGMISERLHYAFRFWPVHVLDVTILSPDLKECLQYLLSTQLFRWIKLCVCAGRYISLSSIRDWIETTAPEDDQLLREVYASQLASDLSYIALRLRETGRPEEALSAAGDAVVTARHGFTTEYGTLPLIQQVDVQDQDRLPQAVDLSHKDMTLSEDPALPLSVSSGLEQNLKHSTLAKALTGFSSCLYDMRLPQRGVRASKEAVELYRYLTRTQGMRFIPHLATSLNGLVILRDMGQVEDALKAIEEAVELRRVLVQNDATAFSHAHGLTISLGNLAICLSDLGRREDSLKAIEEAVQLRRVLVQADFPASTAGLAYSLNNLSVRLDALCRHEEALTAIEEAVQLRRGMVQDQTTAFTPDLASSLINLSISLDRMGRREEALNAIEEAVQLCRRLVQDQAVAFIPLLAYSLINLSKVLGGMGQWEGALKAIEEAVQLERALVRDSATTITLALATSLNNLSLHLGELGRREEALNAIAEAVQLWRVLVEEHATASAIPGLANSLCNMSLHLRYTGRQEDALTAIAEAVQLYRTLVPDNAAAFTPELAWSLNALSNCLSNSGRPEEALKVIEEAVQLQRALFQEPATALTPILAESLNSLSNHLGAVGRGKDGLQASEEALQLYRNLVQNQAAVFNPQLASTLSNQASRWSEIGRHQEALSSAQEAHDLYGILATDRPAVFKHQLQISLQRLSDLYATLGCQEESTLAAGEAKETPMTVQ